MKDSKSDDKEKLIQDLIREAEYELDLARRNLAEATKRFADARTRLLDLEKTWRTGGFNK